MKRSTIVIGSFLILTLIPQAALLASPYETITGCLELSSTGDYVLRSTQQDVTLRNAGGMDKHVGRTVRVTGEWQEGEGGRRLRVAKIEYVAEGCAGSTSARDLT